MPAETIRAPPALGDYVPLSEHQSQTPATFFGGKPVLHYHATGGKAWVSASQAQSLPIFPRDSTTQPTGPEAATLQGSEDELVEQTVDIYTTSDTFILFAPGAGCGVSIPYPTISLHAIKSLGPSYQAIYMQLDLQPDGTDEDADDLDTVELTLIPPASSSPASVPASTDGEPASNGTDAHHPAPASQPGACKLLFEAISACSNLHPDDEGEEDSADEGAYADGVIFEGSYGEEDGSLPGVFRLGGGSLSGAGEALPPPMPGSGGWITAENAHEFFDADGNWIEDEGVAGELGEGAGRVRGRDEMEGAEVDEGVEDVGKAEENGHGPAGGEADVDSKRARVE